MAYPLRAFEVEKNGNILDYRNPGAVDTHAVRKFFSSRYTLLSVNAKGRHITGTLEKNGTKLRYKLATTEGMGVLLDNERRWNDLFNAEYPRGSSRYMVPVNIEYGMFEDRLPYLITDKFEGQLLVDGPDRSLPIEPVMKRIGDIIGFSECIMALPEENTINRTEPIHTKILSQAQDDEKIIKTSPSVDTSQYIRMYDFQKLFLEKTRSWYEAIPEDVRQKYRLPELLHTVTIGSQKLKPAPRHGDFTPWHIFALPDITMGLIDGEHALTSGVEYYDIGYFIQRIHSALYHPDIAADFLRELRKRGYDSEKLKTVLAARAIGGFLDELLSPVPDYDNHERFVHTIEKL